MKKILLNGAVLVLSLSIVATCAAWESFAYCTSLPDGVSSHVDTCNKPPEGSCSGECYEWVQLGMMECQGSINPICEGSSTGYFVEYPGTCGGDSCSCTVGTSQGIIVPYPNECD